MKTTATNRRIRELLTDISDGKLVPRPEFQRRLIWAMRHKIAFIKTVLEGYPFPEIYIAAGDVNLATGAGTLMLVDGQQRLATLYDYFHGSKELRLGKDVPAYDKLNNEDKKKFLEYEVVVRDLGSLEMSEIKAVFQKINSTSYSLNAMEIHNSRYDGEFKLLAEVLSGSKIFEDHKFFGGNEIRRMEDVKFALTLMITMMSGYFNRDDSIEEYLKKFNDEFPQRAAVQKDFVTVSGFIESCQFEQKSRIWKKADFFTAFVELHEVLCKKRTKLNGPATKLALEKLYSEVDGADISEASNTKSDVPERNTESREAAQYAKASIQATNDRSSRITRGLIVRKRLESTLNQGQLL